MMPAEVMLSKLNERMTFNPFKVDIYNFGLVLLELAGNEVKP
jgi:hypothetical protein